MHYYTVIICLIFAVSRIEAQEFELPVDAESRISSIKSDLTELKDQLHAKSKQHFKTASADLKISHLPSVNKLKKQLDDLKAEDKDVSDCESLLKENIEAYSHTVTEHRRLNEDSNLKTMEGKLANSIQNADHLENKISKKRQWCGERNHVTCFTASDYNSKLHRLANTVKNLRTNVDNFNGIEFSSPVNEGLLSKVDTLVVKPVEECIKSKQSRDENETLNDDDDEDEECSN